MLCPAVDDKSNHKMKISIEIFKSWIEIKIQFVLDIFSENLLWFLILFSSLFAVIEEKTFYANHWKFPSSVGIFSSFYWFVDDIIVEEKSRKIT